MTFHFPSFFGHFKYLKVRLDEQEQFKYNSGCIVTDLKQWGWEYTIQVCIIAAKAGCKTQIKCPTKMNPYYSLQ